MTEVQRGDVVKKKRKKKKREDGQGPTSMGGSSKNWKKPSKPPTIQMCS
ncbi:hypothetical protein X975_14670, partial [Stegodyphus mimosarum]